MTFTMKDDEREEMLTKRMELLQRYRENPLLTVYGKEMARLRKAFREDFVHHKSKCPGQVKSEKAGVK